MQNNERVTMVRDCGCEPGCEHKIVSVTEDFTIHKGQLEDFIKEIST
jgi:hypothetical protein